MYLLINNFTRSFLCNRLTLLSSGVLEKWKYVEKTFNNIFDDMEISSDSDNEENSDKGILKLIQTEKISDEEN